MTELGRLLGDEGDVRLSVGENQVSFQINDTLLASKLIEGNYPNYRQVIPGDAMARVRHPHLDSAREGDADPRLPARAMHDGV